jgi:hypothetical protein
VYKVLLPSSIANKYIYRDPKRVIVSSWPIELRPSSSLNSTARPPNTSTNNQTSYNCERQTTPIPPHSIQRPRSNGITIARSRNATIGPPSHNHTLRCPPHLPDVKQTPRHRCTGTTREKARWCFQRRVSSSRPHCLVVNGKRVLRYPKASGACILGRCG